VSQRATRVFAAQHVGARLVLGKDDVYLHTFPGAGPANGKIKSQPVAIKAGRDDMNANLRHLILLSNCSKETGAVTANNLLLAIDHDLGVYTLSRWNR
jgi:hypothetical protein